MSDFGLSEYLAILRQYRRHIYLTLAAALVFTVVLAFIWPKTYVSKTTIIPAFDVQTPFSKLVEHRTIDLGTLLGSEDVSPSYVYAAIIESRTIMEHVVTKCDLIRRFRMNSMEATCSKLRRISTVDVREVGIVSIVVRTNNARLSADIANTWVDELDAFNQQSLATQSHRRRLFLEQRIPEIERQLHSAEDTLLAFQRTHRIASFDAQVGAAIETYTALRLKLISKEIQLARLPGATPESPWTRGIADEMAAIRQKLRIMEKGSGAGHGPGFTVPLSALPALAVQYMRHVRARNSLYDIDEYLKEEYEDARIEEVRNTPTVIVIDRAVPAERRLWPYRSRILFVALLVAASLCILMPLFAENIKKKHADGTVFFT